MDGTLCKTASVFIEVSNDIYIPEQSDGDINTSTDEDVPLSAYTHKYPDKKSAFDVKIKKKLNRTKKNNRKKYEYKKGKKVFRQSDSESEDFEKYVYFDERKIKRKVKLDPKLSNAEIMAQIADIKVENECLNLERDRINLVKLQEKNKLHCEIKRLKQCIKDLKLKNNSNNDVILNIGNTADVINVLKKYLDENLIESNHNHNINSLEDKLNTLEFTDSSFWEDFNSIEKRDDFKNVYWKGNLKNINPNSEYFKPDDTIRLKLGDGIEHKLPKEDPPQFDTIENRIQNDYQEDSQIWNETDHEYNDGELKIVEESTVSDMEIDNVEESDEVNHKNNDEGICSECGHDSSWAAFISRHRKAHVENVKLIPCNLCNMKFLKSGHFDGKHRLKRPERRKSTIRSFICDVCGQGCTTQSGLVQHQLKHNEPLYSCGYCPYKCRRRSYLNTHTKTHLAKSEASDPQKKYPCSMCPQISTSNKDFRLHRSTHKAANVFTCKLCSFTTTKFNTFTKHDRSHNSEKGYQCIYCNYRTMSKSHLNSHIRYHTGNKPSVLEKLICDQCSFETASSIKMNIHKRKHDGVKPFSCNLCQYQCFTRYDLILHDNMHKSDCAMQCEFCDFKTAVKNKMKIHMKKHEDESDEVSKLVIVANTGISI